MSFPRLTSVRNRHCCGPSCSSCLYGPRYSKPKGPWMIPPLEGRDLKSPSFQTWSCTCIWTRTSPFETVGRFIIKGALKAQCISYLKVQRMHNISMISNFKNNKSPIAEVFLLPFCRIIEMHGLDSKTPASKFQWRPLRFSFRLSFYYCGADVREKLQPWVTWINWFFKKNTG